MYDGVTTAKGRFQGRLKALATLGAGQRDHDHDRRVVRSHLHEVAYHHSGVYERYIKRAIDLIVSLFLLFLLTPVLAFLAVLVKWRIGSPVFYAQSRVGRGGEQFRIYKFRTMIPDRRQEDSFEFDGHDRRRVHKSPEDPRVVPFGRSLRRLSLDELPQLWNVVRGDMSLVGPRPELPEIVADYEDWQHARHAVKPGITCLWQISNREELLKDSTKLDLDYIEGLSFSTDLRILLATPAAAIFKKNGY